MKIQPLFKLESSQLLTFLTEALAEDIKRETETIIKKAVEDCEKEMRASLGKIIFAFAERSLAVERYGEDLRIIIKHQYGKKDDNETT